MNKFGCLMLLGLVACDDHGHDEAHDHGAELVTEACEHSAEGPFEDVTAAPDAAGAPSIAFEHTGVRIALTPEARTVKFEAAEAGDHVFFLSEDVPVLFADAQGAPLPVEATAAVEACSEVAVQHTLELPVGTVFLTFGGDATALTVVAEVGSGEHAH